MNPSTTVGRHRLTTRFTAIMRIASISYPDRDQLQVKMCHFCRTF